jgi:ATP-dependent DNA helicase RecG
MDSMDFHELFSLLQSTDEADRIEAKSAVHGIGKSFLETVSAFSNEPDLGGGYILLGITGGGELSDAKYKITGISDPDKLQNDITSQCKQCFNVPIRPILKTVPLPQGTVLLVYIPEANIHEKPVFLKAKGLEEGAYRRIGSSDQVCTREDSDLLYQLRARRKYDETLLENASFADFDPEAIRSYRYERAQIKPDARELRYSDEDLLKAVRAIETEKGVTAPTIGGMLLFGNQMVMRKLFPLTNRVDYILIEGREWITTPERRYTVLEMCESLMTGIPRLIKQIMNDIPQVFALQDDQIRRKDNPIIPRKVIREAVVNALMHKDYRVISPVQIIKYANRTEFRNAGYSLKSQEQLGLPGSAQRNQILAQVFHDIHYAEAKGTGIGTMRDEMRNANLSVPLIESDRAGNLFVLTLLPHHLFDKRDIQWLEPFKEHNLTDEEARTLIVVREKGSISNSEYRTINGVDTLTASSHLRRLRDLGLLEQKGRGNTTYYVLTARLLTPGISPSTPGISPSTPGISPSTPGISPGDLSIPPLIQGLPQHFPPVSDELATALKSIGKRTSTIKVKEIIVELCAIGPLRLPELVAVLQRDPDHLRKQYLSKMIEDKELEYLFPDNPSHPQQAYKTKKPRA